MAESSPIQTEEDDDPFGCWAAIRHDMDEDVINRFEEMLDREE